MIICIQCNEQTKSKLDCLFGRFGYNNYSEIVSLAVENLWLLEQEASSIDSNDPSHKAHDSLDTPATGLVFLNSSRGRNSGLQVRRAGRATEKKQAEIPDFFAGKGLDGFEVAAAPIVPARPEDQNLTIDRWIFGQYNKLLPAKASCRALMHLVTAHPDGVPLEEAAPRISEAAAVLGDYLADMDSRHEVARDNALATAFPHSGPDAEKSRIRYANQFVGSVNSHGVLSGLLSDYRLAVLAPGPGNRLIPTRPAADFSRLANPVFDSPGTICAPKFSPEEAAFLLEHIRAHVPVEAFAFKTLIQAIADGATTPDKLDEALRVHVPTETDRSLSPSFLTSQRSGALSRMADLGLIARERKGVRVRYTITPEGEAFISGDNIRDAKEKN